MPKLKIFVIVSFLLGCAEPIDVEVMETASILVVDASLTNGAGPHTTRLSFTFPLDESDEMPVSGATVWIESAGAERIELSEVEPGTYQTDSSFSATVGESYSLHILWEGRQLMSDMEVLIPPTEIDEIYARYIQIPSELDGAFPFGIQFFLDATGPDGEEGFFRYEYEEAYEVRASFPSQLEWVPEQRVLIPREPPGLSICYQEADSKELLLGSSSGLTGNKILEYPIRFVPETEMALTSRYAIRIKQFSIANRTFQFYRDLQENNESAGSFFDSQKGTSFGNIRDVNDPTFPVLGYFEVAGVSEKELELTLDDFIDLGYRPQRNSDCPNSVLDTIGIGGVEEYLRLNPFALPVFIFGIGSVVMSPRSCSDCRVFGDLEVPELLQ